MSNRQVSFALPYGDSKISRPWSQYSEGSSSFEKLKQQKLANDLTKKQMELQENAVAANKAKLMAKPMVCAHVLMHVSMNACAMLLYIFANTQ